MSAIFEYDLQRLGELFAPAYYLRDRGNDTWGLLKGIEKSIRVKELFVIPKINNITAPHVEKYNYRDYPNFFGLDMLLDKYDELTLCADDWGYGSFKKSQEIQLIEVLLSVWIVEVTSVDNAPNATTREYYFLTEKSAIDFFVELKTAVRKYYNDQV